MSKYLFLIVFASFLILPGEGQPGVCWHLDSHLSRFWDTRCCATKYYDYRFLQEFMEVCSVPPKNDSLSVEDSIWNLMQCMIVHALKGKPLTLTNFATVMTTNFSHVQRSEILSELKRQQENNTVQLVVLSQQAEQDKAHVFQKMWKAYYNAEFDTCHRLAQVYYKKNPSEPEYEDFRKGWEPLGYNTGLTYYCADAHFPSIELPDPPKSVMNPCKKPYAEKYPHPMYANDNCIEDYCRMVGHGWIKKGNWNVTSDYEAFVHKVIPRFFSKVGKTSIRAKLGFALSTTINSSVSDTLSRVVEKAKKYAKEEVLAHEIHSELRTMCTNVFTLKSLLTGVDAAKYIMCTEKEMETGVSGTSHNIPINWATLTITTFFLATLKF